ncbi:glutathione hydrolase 6-like [Leptodactylus fuscus]|uniref:glutathione hydrolase 6-like n=1 Tax=Leptodactylus fuscus TaxID=238119 RepID=UPI003F4EDCC8
MSAVRQEVRYQRLQETENDDQEEVTVHLYSHSSLPVVQTRCRDFGLRICSSLLLLLVAVGFVLYEIDYWSPELPSAEKSFYKILDPPWNATTLEKSSKHPGAHHHSEDHEVTDEHEDHHHGDKEQSGSPPGSHSHSAGTYHHAAVISDSELCSGVARDTVQAGGSVVDAGVAAILCLAVVHSHSVSLGGIFSAVYFNGTTQNASVWNAIPSVASPMRYGIPTVLQGLWSLHQKHGRKPWSELFSPAIHLANNGFVVDSNLHAALDENRLKVTSSVGLQSLFYEQNHPKNIGDLVVNVKLGKTLELARTMTDAALPVLLIHNLLSDFEITDREKFQEALSSVNIEREDPVQLHLDGLTMYSSSPPTAGRILANSVHEVYEKHKNKASAIIPELLIATAKTVYTLAGAWSPDVTANGSAGAQWDLAPVGSNVLVADSAGDVIVISLTLNNTFGSGFVSRSTGILLSDFVQGPSSLGLSFWAGPSVLLFGADNDLMGLAARGGSSLPFSLAHVVLNHVLLQMDLTESINGTLPDLTLTDSDPWLKYLGLQGGAPKTVMAIEVRSDHVHVATSRGCQCHPAGL